MDNKSVFRENKTAIIAHLSMFFAGAFWGLMAPLGKDAMNNGVGGLEMVSFRVSGACLLFWITSLFVKTEKVQLRDIVQFCFAAIFGLIFNQCCYIVGLSLTSPINASIVTTSMPIFAMVLAAIILKEPITGKKALGVLMGCSGALILVLTSAAAVSDKVGDIRGDLLCLFAQFSFSLYLSLFSPLVRRYSVFTVNKWMFFWATVLILPFTTDRLMEIDYPNVSITTWLEVAYVVVFGTYICYILTMIGQHSLRPTVVSIYNYVQPIVSVSVSILIGVGTFQWAHALAIVLVFSGVWLVTKSRAKQG